MKFEGKGKRASIVSHCLVHNLKLEAGNACRERNCNSSWMTCQIVLMNATQECLIHCLELGGLVWLALFA